MTSSSEVDDRRSKLSPTKRALLDMRLRGSASPVSPLAGSQIIGRRPASEASLRQNAATAAAPLSFAQERLWFLDQWQPGDPAYNRPVALHLNGALDLAALERALSEILCRHEVLRAAFPAQDGHPVQAIGPAQPVCLSVTDLGERPSTERESDARRMAAEETQHPFDLTRGPVLRARLLRLGPAEHVLLVVVHHIAFDAWSARVLANELATLYQAFHTGQPSPPPGLSIQYSDYAHWQREWLQGSVLEAQLAYWREQLAGLQTPLDLPTDRSRPPVRTYHGGTRSLVLPAPLLGSLKAFSLREDGTLFMTLLAAFQVLLYRYTGQEDIVVGSPSAGRRHLEVEPLIGFFVNNLVLRTDLSGEPAFRGLLGRVREVALSAYAHQDLPFQKLVEALKPERDPSRPPLFQSLLNLENLPLPPIVVQDLQIKEFEFDDGIARFDLALELTERPDGLCCHLNYSADLFEAATAQRMLGHYQTLLESIVAEPEQRISTLPLLTSAEKQQLLVTWNDTQADYARGRSVRQLFEAQVERTPESVAVVFQDQRLSYHDLNQRANELAHHLRALGVGPEIPVGICVERSIEMVIGVLGILKAGGAYVPLDPEYPAARLAFMIDDAQIPVLVTQGNLLLKLSPCQAQTVLLDKDLEPCPLENQSNPVANTLPGNLAYLIYTSGSTGQPKGVSIPQKGLVNILEYARQRPGLDKEDTFLAVSSLSFDIATMELLLPLTVGARLVVASHAVVADGHLLAATLAASRVTVMEATPTTWRMLLASGWQGDAELRVWCAGEVLSRDLAKQLLQRCRAVWNLYGPTETTIWSTAGQVADQTETVSIGQPVANTQVYIVDCHFQLTPIGVPGELLIGGEGLARGYLGRAALTAERFVPNPFPSQAGARLYRTGDLARYRCDGTIEFLGRADHQVKLRGFRIDLGEVEAVLARHPALGDVVVVLREDVPNDPRLIAYMVPCAQAAPNSSDLRRFLRQELPEYMIPSVFILLPAMPLTPNKKLDRRALPVPDWSRPELAQQFVAPHTPVQERVAAIWAQVLGLRRVGTHDNFFDLGGHSLLAVQILSRTRDAFRIELPVRSLFEAPTVAGFAEQIEARRWTREGLPAESGAETGDREEGEL